ncbi:hypothetical protein ABVT39_018817 [Epinephelus coioides]
MDDTSMCSNRHCTDGTEPVTVPTGCLWNKADISYTVQMVLSQLLYLLAACRITLTYPVCGVLAMLAELTNKISPLTLVVMSLERYVAVCYPLRHCTVITIRNTAVAIIVVWAFSSLNILTRVLLLLEFPFKDLESLQMKHFCAQEKMFLSPVCDDYDKMYTYFLFVSASVAVISSYIGVVIAARSASTDKASAQKARNTLLLHLVQLGLSLSSIIHNPLVTAISKITDRIITLLRQMIYRSINHLEQETQETNYTLGKRLECVTQGTTVNWNREEGTHRLNTTQRERVRLTYPVCGVLTMLSNLTNEISPLTLVVMSLERYVAVCYPLRHSAIITIRNTAVAIIVVWAFSSLNILTRVLLLLEFPFENLESLQMKDFCAKENMFVGPVSDDYSKAYTYFLFISASVAVTSSYICVMIAARSASTDKASARKARNTLLLHLVQLGLSLSSTIHNPLVTAISKITDRVIILHTAQMVLGQLLYLLAACRVRLTYPVCGVLAVLAILTKEISPLTLVVMSLERYVAVCYPLRHSAIITVRNTAVAIIVVWIFSSLNILTRVLLLLEFPSEDLESLQMKDFCAEENMFVGPVSDDYSKAYTYFLFISASMAVTSSYIGVMIAARSASTDKASARKARNTLLLHLVQLGLCLSSTIHNPLVTAISKITDRVIILRIWSIFYVSLILFPRCLSALIYGIRDQAIRSILVYHLCCRLKLSIIPAKAEVSS